MSRTNFDRAMSRSTLLDVLAGENPPPSTPRMIVRVYDGGDMPTEADRVYLCRPAQVAIPEAPAEGGSYSVGVDESRSIPVVFLGRAPAVDELAIAHRIGGAWVATQPGGSTGLCPLCAMEFKEHLKLTFTFSSGEYAYHGYVPKGATGVGDARRHFWRFQPNVLDGSSSNFQFYPDFYLNPSFDLWCGKDRTWLEIRAARSDPSFPHDPIVRLDPVVDLDESHVVSCSPLHIVWSGSASFNRPVPDLGDLVGFEAEEYVGP